MSNTRFKGATSSERLSLLSLSDNDMFQTRHMPGTANDADKGVSKAVLQSVPIAICTTAAATEGKEATLSAESCPDFTLLTGREVLVFFVNGNTNTAPTLNFAGTGTFPIASLSGNLVGACRPNSWVHLKYIDITVSSVRHQKWLLLEENAFMEQDHNVPRFINGVLGKNITEYYSDGTLWKRLNGTDGYSVLEDIYVGDYFQMSRAISAPNQDSQYAETGTAWVTIAGIDTLMGNGSTFPEGDNDCLNPVSGKHHLVLIPGKGADPTEKNHFGRKRMNSSNTTNGGYWGSEMAQSTLGAVVSSGSTASGATINQQLYAEFGSHLKTCNELVSTVVTTTYENRYHAEKGASSSWAWNNVQACLMTEVEVYGSVVWSSSGYDTGTGKTRLPLFAFSTMAINNRKSYYWLRDVASSSYFAHVRDYGSASCDYAGGTNRYVRPRFVIGA